MVANAQKKWTVEEYLAFERQSEERHEYIDGVVFPIGHPPQVSTYGAGRRHSLIVSNVITSFGQQLATQAGEAYALNMRVNVNPTQFIYPDLCVVHDNPRFTDDTFDTLLNPTLILEVLSPRTEGYVRGAKFSYSLEIASLQEYVLIAQNEVRIDHYTRQPNGDWRLSVSDTLEANVQLPSVGCTLALSDVYNKITFNTDDTSSNT